MIPCATCFASAQNTDSHTHTHPHPHPHSHAEIYKHCKDESKEQYSHNKATSGENINNKRNFRHVRPCVCVCACVSLDEEEFVVPPFHDRWKIRSLFSHQCPNATRAALSGTSAKPPIAAKPSAVCCKAAHSTAHSSSSQLVKSAWHLSCKPIRNPLC